MPVVMDTFKAVGKKEGSENGFRGQLRVSNDRGTSERERERLKSID